MRESGILLHPTSLPGSHGVGDLGPGAYDFVDFLARSKQKLWQVLPLNPPGYGESPFQSYSAFAGNPLLISLEALVKEGYLTPQEISSTQTFDKDRVQFDKVSAYKTALLKGAYLRFRERDRDPSYHTFVAKSSWLPDYALFMALKEHFRSLPWNQWDRVVVLREESVLNEYRHQLQEEIAYHFFLQYIFFRQWLALKQYANTRGIRIIGDIPIFVSYDSSDAWANPQLFELDEQGNPTKVAGVPPDYFSATGQLWGNPHYKWEEMEKNAYAWWQQRFASLLEVVDIVRIDHFRGFEAYWEIPAGEETAINGQWVKGPGAKFFAAMIKHLGNFPVIAEDLGVITPEVVALKEQFQFPGMKILHFNLHANEKKEFLPHNYEINSVVYTGTHDNDTTVGWYQKLQEADREFLAQYLELTSDMTEADICWRLIETAFQCKSQRAIIPLQDVLALDSDSRMNYPGTVGGNWAWRYRRSDLTHELEQRLARLTIRSNR